MARPKHLGDWLRRWGDTIGLASTVVGLVVLAALFLHERTRARNVAEATLPAPPPSQPVQVETGLLPLTPTSLEVPLESNAPIAVRAKDAGGEPLQDALVRFQLASGVGVLAADTVRTDAQGIAQTSFRVPARAGAALVTATVAGSALPPVTFSFVARAGPATRVNLATGNQQEAAVAALLRAPVSVQVTDVRGNPVADVEVRFESLSGGGSVAPSRTRTDSLGLATARWRLGPTPGEQRLAAVVPTAPENFLTFTATAIPAAGEEVAAAPPAPVARPPIARPAGPGPTGPAGPVATAPPVAPVAAVEARTFVLGGSHACVLVAGSAACRGANDRGQRGGNGPADFAALASGVSHVCGLDGAGVASCWGANQSGQLGDGSRADRTAPVRVATELRFSTLTAGAAFTCGLSAGGRAACWGQNLNGQIGDGSRDDRRAPQMVAGDRSFRILVAGWNHACGVSTAGETLCWGLNGQGQIGDGTRLDRLAPARVEGSFQELAAGSAHTCGLAQGQVLCWGSNAFGQLGNGTTANTTNPVAVQGLPGSAVRIAAGAVHTCALVGGGTAYCWGQNLYGQLGDGTTQNRSTPTLVSGTLSFSSIVAGGALTCAVALDGARYCWGLNQSGQLGDGSRQNRSTPTRTGG